jgi:hypothetical protein
VITKKAFILVGWVLLVPPLDQSHQIMRDVPVAQWTRQGYFESKEDCERLASISLLVGGRGFLTDPEEPAGYRPQCVPAANPSATSTRQQQGEQSQR